MASPIRSMSSYRFPMSVSFRKRGGALIYSRPFSSSITKRDIRTEHIRKGIWVPKENFADYIAQRIPSLTKYMDSLDRTPNEEAVLQKIKSQYLLLKTTQPVIYPYRPQLDKTTETYEKSGSYHLTEEEIKFYLQNGVVGPIPLENLSSEILQSVFDQYTGITKTLGAKGYRDVRVRQEWVSPEILELACNSEIVSRVSSLLGKNIKVRFTGIHEVAPRAGGFSAATDDKIASLCAHSDMNLGARLSKTGLDGPLVDTDSINVWISITRTYEENAPLFLFPKTHNWPILTPLKYLDHARADPAALQRTFKLLTTAEFGSEIVANHALFYNYLKTSLLKDELSNIQRTEIYTKPGDYIIFSTHLQHGSAINNTDKPRLGISIRYSRATNKENGDTTRLVNTLFSSAERARLGMTENDKRAPILQVLGTKHHESSIPINWKDLHKIIVQKRMNNDLLK